MNPSCLKVFLFAWAEGDPITVLAPNFHIALKRFTAHVRPRPDEPQCSDQQIEAWIETVSVIGDDVVTDDSGN